MARASQAFCVFLLDEKSEIQTDFPIQVTPQGWRYFELSDCERIRYDHGKLARPQPGDRFVQLEAICSGPQKSVLMTSDPEMWLRVNGHAAARYQVLRPGDVLRLGAHALHLSLRHRPYIGPPDEELRSTKCSYCRVPIGNDPDTQVYVCPTCSSPMHWVSDDAPTDGRLQCAKLADHCGYCQARIVEREAFSHAPVI